MPIGLATGTAGLATTVATGSRAGLKIVIEAVYASYSIIGIGTLSIVQDDLTVLFTIDIQNTAGLVIPGRVSTAASQGATVTLAGLPTAIGKLAVVYWGSLY